MSSTTKHITKCDGVPICTAKHGEDPDYDHKGWIAVRMCGEYTGKVRDFDFCSINCLVTTSEHWARELERQGK